MRTARFTVTRLTVARTTMTALIACAMLTFFSATLSHGTRAAISQVANENTGLLALLQPAADDAPAALRFYSPNAQLVHTLTLPDVTKISLDAIAPDGRHWVYLSGAVSGPDAATQDEPLQADLTLHVMRSSDGTEVTAISLLPANFPDNVAINTALLLARDPSLNDFGMLQEAVWQAFRYSLGEFAWSPTGTQLAFSAATDGPSSDLYLYDLATAQVTRLTDGIEQIDGIRWSPNGQWIWHSTIAYSYCQVCGGHNFAAAADGSQMVTLPGDDVYRFLMWVADDAYLVTDQANGPGYFALQRVNIATGSSQMLWEGTHQGFIYDATLNRLGINGTRGQRYEADTQLFVVDLAAGLTPEGVTEYDDLASALAVEEWLAPLDQRTITYPCHRPGPTVYPCVTTIFDALAPDGTLQVTANYAVEETGSGAKLLPSENELAPNGRVLWRLDGEGIYITQPNLVVYRDLATGTYTVIDDTSILGWLPYASRATFAAPTPAPIAPAPLASPEPELAVTPPATPIATPVIEIPYRYNTLDGSHLDVTIELRTAQARELALVSQGMTYGDDYTDKYARTTGLNLLLAHEAAHTYLESYALDAPAISVLEPALATEIDAALDAGLANSLPRIASYPPDASMPNAYALALSPDGTTVAMGDTNGSVLVWDYQTGALLRVLPNSTTSIQEIRFSSDSTMLAAADTLGQVTMWYVDSGFRSTTHVAQYMTTSDMAWRPYTYDLAVANGETPVMIHPRSSRAYPLFDATVDASAEALAYSLDGTKLAIALSRHISVTMDSRVRPASVYEERPIWIVDADTGALLYEIPDDRTTDYLGFTPDGKTLVVSGADHVRAWDIATSTLRFETEIPSYPADWTISADGTQLAILSRASGISYYDLRDGTLVRNLPVDADSLDSLAIHPTDGNLVSGDIKGRPILLDPTTGAITLRFGAPRARLATTSAAAALLATADRSIVTLYDLHNQRVRYQLMGAQTFLTDIAFSMDGKWVAAREETGELSLWDTNRGQLQWRVAFDNEYAGRVAFAGDGRIIVGGSAGILRVVDPTTGNMFGQVNVGDDITALAASRHNEATVAVGKPRALGYIVNLDDLGAGVRLLPVLDGVEHIHGPIAYSPDGSLLAVPRGVGLNFGVTLELWDTDTQERVQAIDLGHIYDLTGLAFSPDGQRIATGARDVQPITIWEVATGAKQQELGPLTAMVNSMQLAFGSTGTELFVSDNSGITRQYALTPTHRLRTITGHRGSVWDVAIAPNGRWTATTGDDQRVRLWNLETGAQLNGVIVEPERIASVDFSPNGDAILTGSYDGAVRLYYNNGVLQKTFTGHIDKVVDAIFRPDGNAFATASLDGSVQAWNRARAMHTWNVEGLGDGVSALAYAPDSTLLAGAAGGGPNATIYVWDAYSGEEIMQLHGHGNYIVSLAFSPDGALLASGSWDRTIKLWDVASGDEVAALAGHDDLLTDVAFSPDGTLLASVAEDYTLRLWDVAKRSEQTHIDLPRALPWAVAFSPDGHALLTTHADGALRTWLVDPADTSLAAKMLVAAARVPRATAQFTAAESNTYAINSHIGAYALSASGSINLRAEPYFKSLVVRQGTSPADPETLIALTNEKFLLTSVNQGESWRVVARLPLTRTYTSLSVLARPTDPLLVASEQGLYRVADDGALTLIHNQSMRGVSYSHTNPNELWAVSTGTVYKSEDGGETWGTASNELSSSELFAPLLLASPNNNPQIVVGHPVDRPAPVVWRGAGNGFWERIDSLPYLPSWTAREQGMAWDEGNRTLYLSGAQGELYAVPNLNAPNLSEVSASIVEHFGVGTRPLPLAVGAGPSLYVNLLTTYGPRTLRGTWDGSMWHWVELRLPLVGAG